jgi:uncharacterized protein YhfF
VDWQALETFSFGDNPELADELADLVLAGKKSATCWAAAQGFLTEVGKRMVMLDGSGRARAVIETVELTQRRFAEVDAAFAFDEGEGDQTLAYWRKAHERYAEPAPLVSDCGTFVKRFDKETYGLSASARATGSPSSIERKARRTRGTTG